ncbi:Transmembrane protein 128 [Dillenia turbinata]|uniref:Transmembrane protein 128 n=1 Tax=Dillenia turbinata TaxID=194707 RepID=A0AAN8VWP2_9MAGN
MSGGTPVGSGFMRQRHSQGYASSGDDLEDDACSRTTPSAPSIQRARTWVEVAENVLWIASALFIVYFGDRHSNFICLLWHDHRIKRMPLYLGMLCVGLNVVVMLYTSPLVWNSRKSSEKWELSSPSSLPIVTVLGIISFSLFCFALWPIWSILTLPLLFTLFMACMVISPYLVNGPLKPQSSVLRTD